MLDCFNTRSSGLKHHYIPVFYLKNWAGIDKKICEYSRPYKDVVARRKYPSATGYEREHVLDRDIMQRVDQRASDVLKVLLDGASKLTFGPKEKVAWSLFLVSLIQRHPQRVEHFCQTLDQLRRRELEQIHRVGSSIQTNADQQALEKLLSSTKSSVHTSEKEAVIQAITFLPQTIKYITEMRWHVVPVSGHSYEFLTSDQAVVMSDGLKYPHSYILLLISPAHLFIVTNVPYVAHEIGKRIKSDYFIRDLNDHVCFQAQKYVYGRCDAQLRFVEKRLWKREIRGTRANQGSLHL
jgi:hypothetical protein